MEIFKGVAITLIGEVLIFGFKKLTMENLSQADTLYFVLTNIILFLGMFVWKYIIDKKENDKKYEGLIETQRLMFEALLKQYGELFSELHKKADK